MSELRTCPYNPHHTTVAHRFHTHLIKCRKANPHMKLTICPFNGTHHVPEEEFPEHVKNCPARVSYDAHHFFKRING